jgi:hypothetical protein
MTITKPEHMETRQPGPIRRETVEEQASRRGIKPVVSVEDMVCFDAFESDEEVDEFIAFVYAQRRASLA